MAARRIKAEKNLNNSPAMLGLLIITAIIVGALYYQKQDMKLQEQTYIQREEALEREISDEEARTLTLKERKKYVSTDQYIKEIAKDKLGLLSPDEILLKENDN